jgi:hypothetical protein
VEPLSAGTFPGVENGARHPHEGKWISRPLDSVALHGHDSDADPELCEECFMSQLSLNSSILDQKSIVATRHEMENSCNLSRNCLSLRSQRSSPILCPS